METKTKKIIVLGAIALLTVVIVVFSLVKIKEKRAMDSEQAAQEQQKIVGTQSQPKELKELENLRAQESTPAVAKTPDEQRQELEALRQTQAATVPAGTLKSPKEQLDELEALRNSAK